MDSILLEYDNICIGKYSHFGKYFKQSEAANQKNALTVMRYAFDHYLPEWTPDDLCNNLNKDILNQLHLGTLMNYIKYPVDYDKEKDYFYLVSLLYPERRISVVDQTLHTYENILNSKDARYPRDYFVGADGMERAFICLQYVIAKHVSFHSINDLYYFIYSDDGQEFLKKYKLSNVCRQLFPTPVDYLHYTLPKDYQSPFLLNYYRYRYEKKMRENISGRVTHKDNEMKLIIKDDD